MLIFNVHNGLSTMQFDFSGWDCIYLIFKGIPFDPAEALQPFMDMHTQNISEQQMLVKTKATKTFSHCGITDLVNKLFTINAALFYKSLFFE